MGEEAVLRKLNDEMGRLQDMVAAEQAARRDLETKVMKQMDEKCLALHVELAKERRLRTVWRATFKMKSHAAASASTRSDVHARCRMERSRASSTRTWTVLGRIWQWSRRTGKRARTALCAFWRICAPRCRTRSTWRGRTARARRRSSSSSSRRRATVCRLGQTHDLLVL